MYGRLSSHFCQLFVRTEGKKSSESIFLFQTCWMIHFDSIKAGTISPNRSKIELIRDRISRLVAKTDLSVYFIWNVSVSGFHNIPKARSIVTSFTERLIYVNFREMLFVGKAWSIERLFEINLVSRKRFFCNIFMVSRDTFIATEISWNEDKESSM